MDDKSIEIIMGLIMHGGNARGKALQAISLARENKLLEADEAMKECDKELTLAHQFHKNLLTKEANSKPIKFSLIMIHGQDHLMSAITTRDLALEIIEILRKGIQ